MWPTFLLVRLRNRTSLRQR